MIKYAYLVEDFHESDKKIAKITRFIENAFNNFKPCSGLQTSTRTYFIYDYNQAKKDSLLKNNCDFIILVTKGNNFETEPIDSDIFNLLDNSSIPIFLAYTSVYGMQLYSTYCNRLFEFIKGVPGSYKEFEILTNKLKNLKPQIKEEEENWYLEKNVSEATSLNEKYPVITEVKIQFDYDERLLLLT